MNEKKAVEYGVTFEKKGDMVYISHLDLMTLFRRAVRRADLPFVLSQGFTPRVRISIPKALKLGTSSSDEKMTLFLSEEKDVNEIKEILNEQLPEGVRIIEIKKV